MDEKVVGNRIEFWNENEVMMYIDYLNDECVWYFNNGDEITISEDSLLFEPLRKIMLQKYEFDNEVLNCSKTDNKLLWYSDCYYNPEDFWSRESVSYLTIEAIDNTFKLKCTKPLDENVNRNNKSHVIAFSPLGNGRYAKNINSG